MMKNDADKIREKLENRINDAADGLLSETEIKQLEAELATFPELAKDFKLIMALPDLSKAYNQPDSFKNGQKIAEILSRIVSENSLKDENTALFLFRKYALAASLLILGGISVFNLTQSDAFGDVTIWDELFYPYEEGSADEYVLYLENWLEPEN
jgi:hypothetical protein